ncbi:putative phage putative head morphogenesis protein, SPP1 gp7 family [Fusobacterium animalis 11_3_2]|uniref:Phage putative head morphogenesis protein, SPP1 gp7 family n=1 Tax=Fusobacterium animalis 11_3_2 TaxID=457403 RepID=F7L177_9FUSO|nr:minor capsid protein [Fusobacterium animalis]EGN66629.1 putative phage putative head morphogenesis protein, SPP1 gp7 family [Fusobacterium animalis 11_3_2]
MSNYWTKRFEEEEKQRNISNKAYVKEIEKQYKIAENKIKSDIEKWYIRIADNNQISLADAKKLLTKDELKEFKWILAEYTQKAKSGAWKKELENASARVHIQRLEALQLQVKNSIETLRNKENEMLEDYLIKNYEDTYYHSLYEISKGLNLKTSFATLDKNKINQVIIKPWLKDGKNFSDRIWQDKEQLINTLRTKITQSFITGSTLDEAVEDISKFVSDKIKNKEYVARRLLETESAAYASKAQIEAFKSIDVDKYEIVATLDLHTSEICQEMDGKVFNISDQEIGVTVPPFHSHCRTVIAPYFDDEPTRVSRDENGEYKEVKYMNYKEWKDQYIKKDTDKLYIQVNGKGNLESKNKSDIIKSRNATIDKEIKENVLKDVKHNSGLGTVGKRTLRNLGLDENLNFEMMDARGSVSSDCDIELTKSKKIMYRRKFKTMNLSLNDERNLYYREKTIFHESYHAMLDNKLVDVYFSDVDFIDKWRDIEEVFAESSGHYLSDLVGNKVKLGVSYPERMAEVLPRLKKFRKFKECKTISDFGRIAYYERYKGKNAIWIPIRDVIFKQELDILEYSKQYVDYIEKNKSKIFTLIYKNAPDILSKEEVVEIVDRSTEIMKNTTSIDNLTDFEKEIFYNVLVSAMKLKGVK